MHTHARMRGEGGEAVVTDWLGRPSTGCTQDAHSTAQHNGTKHKPYDTPQRTCRSASTMNRTWSAAAAVAHAARSRSRGLVRTTCSTRPGVSYSSTCRAVGEGGAGLSGGVCALGLFFVLARAVAAAQQAGHLPRHLPTHHKDAMRHAPPPPGDMGGNMLPGSCCPRPVSPPPERKHAHLGIPISERAQLRADGGVALGRHAADFGASQPIDQS